MSRPEAARRARTVGVDLVHGGRGAPEGADLVGLGSPGFEEVGDAPEGDDGVHRSRLPSAAEAADRTQLVPAADPCHHRHMAAGVPAVAVEVDGRSVKISNPDKVFFSARGETKLDLVRYYFAVGPGALRGVRERPTVLKRYPDGAEGPFFYQKRVPLGPSARGSRR